MKKRILVSVLFYFLIQNLWSQNFATVNIKPSRKWDTCRVMQSQSFAIISLKSNVLPLPASQPTTVGSKNFDKKNSIGGKADMSQVTAPQKEKNADSQPRKSGGVAESKTNEVDTKVTPEKYVAGASKTTKDQQAKLVSAPTESNILSPSSVAESDEAAATRKHEKPSELGEEYTGSIPRYYALIIGIDKYKFDEIGLPSLDYPVKDARRIKHVLTEQYAFDDASVKLLENPVRSTIIDSFEELATRVTEKDNLLIFYAGHGYYDKEKGFGYWLPSNSTTQSKSDWISNTIVRDYLGAIKAKHTLLISDACFSGSIFKSRNVMANMMAKISEMYKYPSRRAMTSGNLSQVPDKSYFAEFLVRRLSDNSDAFLPAQTLFYRIFEPVNNNSPATPQFGVVQGTGDEGGDFIFTRRTKR